MLTSMLAAVLATVPAPQPLKGAGPWTVEFADKMCAMGRNFAAPAGLVTLVVKAPLLGEDYTFTVASAADSTKKAALGKAYIVKRDGTKAGPYFLKTFTSSSKKRVARFSINGESFKLRDTGNVLAIELDKEGSFAFAVAGMPKALDKLEECTKGLRKNFGIDQQMLDRVSTNMHPIKTLPSVFKYSDYPRDALIKGEQGTVGVLAFVGTNGRVADCKVVESSGFRSLDNQTCNIIVNRARYTPARDAQDAKLRVPIYVRISWSLSN